MFFILSVLSCFVSNVKAAEFFDNSMSFVVMDYPNNKADYPYGHVAMRIRGVDYDHVLELCVGGQLLQGMGDGLCKFWAIGSDGIQKRVIDGAVVKEYEFFTTEEQNKLAINHFSNLCSRKINISYNEQIYISKTPYHFLDNNCVTMATDLFEKGTGLTLLGNSQGSSLSNAEYLGLSVLSLVKYYTWPSHVFTPQDLTKILDNDARFAARSFDDLVEVVVEQ